MFCSYLVRTILTSSLLTGAATLGLSDPVFKPDAGKFILKVRGMEIGSDTFKTDAQGGSEADEKLSLGGREVAAHISIKATKGRTKRIEADAGGGNRFVVSIEGSAATLAVGDQAAVPVALPANVLPTGNYAPHLMDTLIAEYDAKKGGTQWFKLVETEQVGPNGLAVVNGKLTSDGTKNAAIHGKPAAFNRYKLVLAGIETELTADASGHLLLWNVPAQSYFAVRDGYDELAPSN